ncbi:MAG: sigma-70 family RNA polymerase sigma factor [Myxococcota bacterium]
MTVQAPVEQAPDELDPDTVRAAQRGDEVACRVLYRKHASRVHAFVVRLLGAAASESRAEELVQDTFLRVFRALPRFRLDGPASLSTWVFSIAYRVAVSELRRKRVTASVSRSRHIALVSDEQSDDIARQRELYRQLARALDALSPQQRAVFLLRDYHQQSYQEIATALDIESGTVRSRLHRARAAIRGALQEIDDDT